MHFLDPYSLDPHDNYFRIRLICTLLETCGQYFDHGSSRKRLDNFFIFFQVVLSAINILLII